MRCVEMLPYIRAYMLPYVRAYMLPYIRACMFPSIRMHVDATCTCTFKVRAYLIDVGASRSCGHARLACHLII
jgi:hypothetical protein